MHGCSAYMYVCAHMFSSTEPVETRRGRQIPGSGFRDAHEPLGGCWDLNSDPPREQQIPSATSSALPHSKFEASGLIKALPQRGWGLGREAQTEASRSL